MCRRRVSWLIVYDGPQFGSKGVREELKVVIFLIGPCRPEVWERLKLITKLVERIDTGETQILILSSI